MLLRGGEMAKDVESGEGMYIHVMTIYSISIKAGFVTGYSLR